MLSGLHAKDWGPFSRNLARMPRFHRGGFGPIHLLPRIVDAHVGHRDDHVQGPGASAGGRKNPQETRHIRA